MPIVQCYFAYGSNMNTERVHERGLATLNVQSGTLPGFRLKFNKGSRILPLSGRANIVQEDSSEVFGVLYRLGSETEIVKMDRFEHAPIDYRRLIVEVQTETGSIPSWTYIANPRAIDDRLQPTRSYLNHLLAGRSMLPDHYVAQLETVSCID